MVWMFTKLPLLFLVRIHFLIRVITSLSILILTVSNFMFHIKLWWFNIKLCWFNSFKFISTLKKWKMNIKTYELDDHEPACSFRCFSKNKPQVKIEHTQLIRRLLCRNPNRVSQICWSVLAKMEAAVFTNYCMQELKRGKWILLFTSLSVTNGGKPSFM